MSYCRWSDGDLYVVSSSPLHCHCCILLTPGPLSLKNKDFVGTKVEMLAHLKEHRAAGHAFPIYAIKRLEAEVEEEARTGGESSFYLRPLPSDLLTRP